MTAPDILIGRGREALDKYDWEEARAAFTEAVAAAPSAEAYEGLAWAAWWLNDVDLLLRAREEAVKRYQAAGNLQLAARNAIWLSSDYADFRGDFSIANGWRQRALRLLEGFPRSIEHAWLALFDGDEAILVEEDPVKARQAAATALPIGRELGVPDIEAICLATEGLALVLEGHVTEGMKILEEAGTAAIVGEMQEAFSAGWVLCYVLSACERTQDYDRADEWCEKMLQVAQSVNSSLANAICRAHYAGVLILRGKWPEAEGQLEEVVRLHEVRRPSISGERVVRLAELRRRQGRFEEAKDLFEEAEWHPYALSGLAELALDTGKPADAREHAQRLLRQTPEANRTQRASAHELLVRAAAQLGDIETAQSALAHLTEIAAVIGTSPIRAAAKFAAAVVALASNHLEEARENLEDARDLFELSAAPYESARTRLELARVLNALGRRERARHEASRALKTSRDLGATFQSETAAELLKALDELAADGDTPADGAGPLTPRQVEVLRLISRGMSDREIARALVVSEHTVHRHVANILERFDVPSRASAVAHASSLGLI